MKLSVDVSPAMWLALFPEENYVKLQLVLIWRDEIHCRNSNNIHGKIHHDMHVSSRFLTHQANCNISSLHLYTNCSTQSL